MTEHVRQLQKREALITVLLVAAMAVLAYLSMAGQLGFYRDDWHVVWSGTVRGPLSVFDLHLVDRPFMGAVYTAAYFVLGNNPLAWYLYAFALRLAGGLAFLGLVRGLWPSRRWETTAMALLFVVYPGFLQMPEANAYQAHLTALLAGLLSLALTVQALKSGRRRTAAALTVLAVLSALFSYMIMEWMVGLEGARLALIVYWTLRRQPARLDAARKVFLRWLPTLAAAGVFLFWRLFIFKSARPVTDTGALKQMYLSNPLGMLLRLAVETGRDFFETAFLAYGVPLYNLTARAGYLDLLAGLGLALIGAGLVWLAWRLLYDEEEPDEAREPKERSWQAGAAILGAAMILFALLPVTLSNRDVLFADTFDRYTLAAMPGVAILLVAGISALLRRPHQVGAVALLLGISILTHYQNGVYFHNFWEYQRQVWWQLSWRAPDLKDNTALVVQLPEAYRLAEGYEVWGPANLIYRPQSIAPLISAETLNDQSLLQMLRQESYGRSFRRVEYTVDFKNLLALSEPGYGACLHALDRDTMEVSEHEDPSIRLLAAYSSVGLILPDAEPKPPPQGIFGREPAHGWCYYYQKAALARQRQDWAGVARLGDEAAQKGLSPQDVSEWMPFYGGYAQTGDIARANNIGEILRANPDFLAAYCQAAKARPVPEGKIEQYLITNICVEPE